jgi:aryl-alcohol dehydrogenase-like predicted oxidoreductase
VKYVDVNGVRVSAIGLGTWQFGSKDWGYGSEYAEGEAGRIVERSLELGVNFFDTAEAYGRGASERILGRALAQHRSDAFIATKFFPITPLSSIIEKHGRASAARLGIDRIDLYQIHWPNPVVPLAEQIRGLRRLLDGGVIAHAGVSNYSLGRWQAAERALGAPVLSNQVQYNLAFRKYDDDLVPWAAAHDRIVIAYSPLAKGLLSGRYDATNLPKNSARVLETLFLPENVTAAHEMIETLRAIGKTHDATPAQVALAWVISHPNVVAIPGASRVSQLEANVAAADLDLTGDEIANLNDVSARFRPVGGVRGQAKAVGRLVRR